MYLVVSYWEPLPGREEDFRAAGPKVRAVLKAQPGVEMIEGLKSEEGVYIAVHAYSDEEAYKRIVQDPNGPFQKAIAETGLEHTAKWLRSHRGQSLD